MFYARPVLFGITLLLCRDVSCAITLTAMLVVQQTGKYSISCTLIITLSSVMFVV